MEGEREGKRCVLNEQLCGSVIELEELLSRVYTSLISRVGHGFSAC